MLTIQCTKIMKSLHDSDVSVQSVYPDIGLLSGSLLTNSFFYILLVFIVHKLKTASYNRAAFFFLA